MRPRRRMPGRFLAVDMDSRVLRIVCAERTGRHIRIARLLRADFPDDLDATDASAVGGFLAATLRGASISAAAMVMSVPRGQAVLKPVRLPPGTDEADLPDMVRYQVERELPFRIEEAVVDFTISRHYHVDDSPETDGRLVDAPRGQPSKRGDRRGGDRAASSRVGLPAEAPAAPRLAHARRGDASHPRRQRKSCRGRGRRGLFRVVGR